MNQDSDKNENRRDGDSNRSFGRRDDGRTGKPAGTRSSDADRPRFNRDGPRNDRDAGARSRFGRSDAPRSTGPRRDSNAGDRPRTDRSRDERPADTGRPPFGSRDGSGSDRNRPDRPAGPSRPSFGRDRNESDRSRSSDSRPRFDRDERPRPADSDQRRSRDTDRKSDQPNERPRFNREERPNTPGQRPPFNRDDRPQSRDGNARPYGDRSTRGSGAPERLRFERRDQPVRDDSDRKPGDTPRSQADRSESRTSDVSGPRPFNRDDNRSDRRSGEARPRNDRSRTGGASRSRSDKPAGSPDRFKRVGGFSREADERNRANWSAPDKREGRTSADGGPRSGESDSRNTRFTPEQRKDSGDRRTGFFVKAPNYELEQRRREGEARPGQMRPRTDKYAGMPPKSRSDARPDNGDRNEKPTRTPGEPDTTRLNRYIANSGVCSRREADELIAQGDISVNGKVVTEMGFRVKEGDMVKYGTKALTPERFIYVLLNKPKDYITTTEDPDERKTVMELVADAGNFRMYPVGRLDRKTTGLLLLTNDGELADKLTHPSNEVRKIYQVELDKPITEEHFDAIKKGIDLEDGSIKPDALSIVTPDAQVVGIEIHSGRNHIVRRMFENFGYEVTKLDRTSYAGLTKKELPRGKWRFLDPKEVVKLKYLS